MGGHLSLRRGLGLLLVATVVSFAAGAGFAQELLGDLDPHSGQPIEITADEIVYERLREVYVARGSVRVVQGDRRIDADWIVFNRATRRGIAAGKVRAVDADDVLEARFIEFDNAAQRGLVLTGRLDLGEDDFRLAAGELIKIDEDRYEGTDVSMTTCRCPDDDDRLPWVINADQADVEIGGYATVTNSTVDILGVPAVWIPWAFFPVKSERATGFLPPELRFGGGNGFEFALPFFWAARDNINVTVTPRYMTTRGFKPELLFETVYGKKSSTTIFGSYLDDQNPDEGRLAGDPRPRNLYDTDRWGVGFDNDIHAPGGLRLRSDIQIVSDNEYVRDFEEFNEYRRDRFLESVAFGFGHVGADGSGAGVVSAVYRDDRQNPDRADRDQYLLNRAGGAELAWLPTRLERVLGIEFGMGADYTHFWSRHRASDRLDLSNPVNGTVQGKDRFVDVGIPSIPGLFPNPVTNAQQRAELGIADGVFQEGEPLNDEGHRVVLNPHVGHSFRFFDMLDLRPEVGWHETLYYTDAQPYDRRGFLTARADLHSQLLGGFDLGDTRFGHLVEPRVSWAYVMNSSQSGNPFFVPQTRVPQDRLRQQSLDNVVLDDADRIDPANVVTLGVGNHFYVGDGKRQRLVAELDASVAYDFRDWKRGGGDFGLAVLEGRLLGWKRIRGSFNFAWDLEKSRVDQGLFDVTVPLDGVLGLKDSSRVRLGYRYRKEIGRFFENFESSPLVDDVGGTFDRFQEQFSEINQVTAATRLRLTAQWAIDYQVAYSIHRSQVLRNRGTLEYTSECRCWAIQAMVEDNRTRGLRGGINFTFLGFGMDRDEPFKGGGMLGSGVF